MDDRSAALVLGTVVTIGFGVLAGIMHIGAQPSAAGGDPAGPGWPEDRRGMGTTGYDGGHLGLGVTLSLGNDPDVIQDSGSGPLPLSWGRHGYRYPCRPGEVLEAVMNGSALPTTPLAREQRQWLYMPPARMGVDSDG